MQDNDFIGPDTNDNTVAQSQSQQQSFQAPLQPSALPPSGDPSTLSPILDLADQYKDLQQKDLNRAHAERSQRRKDMLTGMLGNFVFSLGQGLQASAQAPRGQENAAGAGAALQGPQILQQMRQEQQMSRMQMADIAAQIKQRNAAAQRTPLIDPETGQYVLDPNGQQIMSTPAEISRNLRDYHDNKSKTDIADAKLKWQRKTAADANNRFYWKNGYSVGFDENGQMTEPKRLPDNQLPVGLQEQETRDELAANRNGQTIDRSTFPPKTAALAKDDPRYPAVLRLREEEDDARKRWRGVLADVYAKRIDQNDQRIQIASAELGNKVYGPAMESDTRLRAMTDAAGKDYQGKGDTADLQLLFNHIGMVLSSTHNVRFSQAMIEDAMKAGGEGETQEARAAISLYRQLVSGQGRLTPAQRKSMVENARMQRNAMYDKAGRTAGLDGIKYAPAMDATLPPLENQSVPAMPTAPTAPGGIGRPDGPPAPAGKQLTEGLIQQNLRANPGATRAQIVAGLKAAGYK